jgi:hypothetical protein
LGVGAYDLVRILHDMSQAHSKTVQPGSLAAQLPGSTSIGYGLIVLVAASFIGLLLTLSDIDRSR